jgi:predicted DNA-binding transcriptional regulator AlpA
MSRSLEVEYVTSETILARFGNPTRAWIPRKIASAGFPSPVFLGSRRRYWRLAEVIQWERRMIARGAPAVPSPFGKSRARRKRSKR